MKYQDSPVLLRAESKRDLARVAARLEAQAAAIRRGQMIWPESFNRRSTDGIVSVEYEERVFKITDAAGGLFTSDIIIRPDWIDPG